MRKLGLIIFMLHTFTFILKAQSDIRINSYLENGYYINPASINQQYTAEFSMAARTQWLKFSGAPRTIYAAATVFSESLNMQMGLKFFSDKIGYTSVSNLALSYAYLIKLNPSWKLLLGINGSYENISYDLSEIKTKEDDMAFYNMLDKRNNFNSDFGFEFRTKRFKIGAASKNIFSMFEKKEDDKRIQFNTNYLYAQKRMALTDFVDFGLGTCAILSGDIFQLELNASAYMRWDMNSDQYLQLGLLYRTKQEFGFLFGIDVTQDFKLMYSYDYHTGGISRSSVGTHEIILVYRIGRLYECRTCW